MGLIRHSVLPFALLPPLLSGPVTAKAAYWEYLNETGYTELRAELGAALPTGAGVGVTQVESGAAAYAPEAGSGTFTGVSATFAGKTFRALSGDAAVSGHAIDVGAHFYGLGTDPVMVRAGFTRGITAVDLYHVGNGTSPTSWLGAAWLTPSAFTAPLVENRAVQNHSWISNYSAIEETELNHQLRRLDFAIERDGFLCVAGVNNQFPADPGSPAVPALLCSAYNNISVGLTTGMHSAGGVVAGMDGPGRQKPEIVAPLDYTSFSTALVSSAAALLREKADTLGAAAPRPQTLKAVLLAGATKEEFPAWSRTPAAPLDARFGAGELNILHSWHILGGGAQTQGKTTPSANQAWGVSTGPAEWRLVIPEGEKGAVLSVAAVWHRMVRDAPGPGFDPVADPLADYNLTLARITAAGSAEPVDESRSAIENVEHLHNRELPSGTYRIRLTLDSGAAVPCSVAWRLHTAAHTAGIFLTYAENRADLRFDRLLPGQRYQVEASPDLTAWSGVHPFTAEAADYSWTTTPSVGERFYRLAAVNP